MQHEERFKTCSLLGTSDLTVVAPLRKGFVSSLDAVTYKTRVKRVLRTLHRGRSIAHEFDYMRVLSDAVERVGRIHSVRIAVLEPQDAVLLAVTFDGPLESYVRVIWQKVVRLLDLIFCNTEDYVFGWENSFAEWERWLRSRQVETQFLYAIPSLTASDAQYLRMFERYERRTKKTQPGLTRLSVPSTEQIAESLLNQRSDPTDLGYSQTMSEIATVRMAATQGLRALVGLHRLSDVYSPSTPEDKTLVRAACELLPEFGLRLLSDPVYQSAVARHYDRFGEAIDWLRAGWVESPPATRVGIALPTCIPAFPGDDVQGGIVETYSAINHAAIAFVAFDSRTAVADFLDTFTPTVASVAINEGESALNIAFSVEGLRLAGLTETEIRALPEEFVQGMAARAGLLGDVRCNHPSRWRLPPLNWSKGPAATDVTEDDPVARVELGAVHAVIQVRLCAPGAMSSDDARNVMFAKLQGCVAASRGVLPLSIQWMHRMVDAQEAVVEHFGYVESNSQPGFTPPVAPGKLYRDEQVGLGEALIGYANEADAAPTIAPLPSPELPLAPGSLLKNGSFLVIRKLRQDVGLLDQVLDDALAESASASTAVARAMTREDFKAKMMGRWPSGHAQAGEPLVPRGGHSNDFTFEADPAGSLCPFHAHIRRANPRTSRQSALEPFGGRTPRLFRRSLPYGRAYSEATADEERGLVFMAYNASIGEQFEVVQRWLSGGNSSGSYSGQGDPFLGVAEPGRRRLLRFEHRGIPVRMRLDGSDLGAEDPVPLVRLEWGLYLFAPSVAAMRYLAGRGRAHATPKHLSWSPVDGEREIGRLKALEAREGAVAAQGAWKAALEDPDATADSVAASIWAAIRQIHGGVLRTPFGVLVASSELVRESLTDTRQERTVNGYLPRMRRSFGEIYLGHDAGESGEPWERESKDCNAAILSLDHEQAYLLAYKSVQEALDRYVAVAYQIAEQDEQSHWELTLDVRELVTDMVADICEAWFGLSTQDGHFERSGFRWDWSPGRPPSYPGHFMAPSRYYFQPHPGEEVERLGIAHGQALRRAMRDHLSAAGASMKAPVARAVLGSVVVEGDVDLAARTLIGALVGFVPTVDANLRRTVVALLLDQTFWHLRAHFAEGQSSDYQTAMDRYAPTLTRALLEHGAPEVLWRTATVAHDIGRPPNAVSVAPGETVVIGLASAAQEHLERGIDDVTPLFGGGRGGRSPTHACPGYGPAMAVLLGFIAAMSETAQAMRPGPSPSALYLRGLVAPRGPLASGVDWHTYTVKVALARPRLFAIGDSWLCDRSGYGDTGNSLMNSLSAQYDIDASAGCGLGRSLADMAHPGTLSKTMQALAQSKAVGIIMGGGGNDVIGSLFDVKKKPLYRLLVPGAASGKELREDEVRAFIDGELLGYYTTILKEIRKVNASIPVFIHAYDYPVPDGRPFQGSCAVGWLKPAFCEVKISQPSATEVMERLIARLNDMVKGLSNTAGSEVHHLRLGGTLKKQTDYADDYRKYWKDELHATIAGFDALAAVAAMGIKAVIP